MKKKRTYCAHNSRFFLLVDYFDHCCCSNSILTKFFGPLDSFQFHSIFFLLVINTVNKKINKQNQVKRERERTNTQLSSQCPKKKFNKFFLFFRPCLLSSYFKGKGNKQQAKKNH